MPAHKDGPKATILVVEDEPLIRTALADALRHAGYSVVELSEAKEALGHLREGGAADLVITDLKMPGAIDGVDLVEWLQSALPTMPVIVTTGYHSLRGQVNAVPVFEKPYRFERLIEQICEMLNAS
jgi:DNA-binding NtrC family response regulator